MRQFAILCYNSDVPLGRNEMPQSVRLSDELVKQAKAIGDVMSRSGAGQIEHWAKIGKIAEDNPDLTYEFIRDALIARAEADNGLVSDYEFDN